MVPTSTDEELTVFVTAILGDVVVVTEAVSPVITLLKSLPVADALFRKVPTLELVVTVNESVLEPDEVTVAESVHVRTCPVIEGSLVVSPVVKLLT